MGKLKGFMTGGLLGLIAGILVAPKKGEETRQQLKDEGQKFSEKAKPVIENAKPKIEEWINKAKELFAKK